MTATTPEPRPEPISSAAGSSPHRAPAVAGRWSWPLGAALCLALLHLAFSLWVNPPGYLTYDSGTYHFMAKTFAETGGFQVWNGYEEFPSDTLRVAQLQLSGGHLVAQYPELLTVLGYPFYAVFGYHGLLLMEALAFLGINWLLFQLAYTLFRSRAIAWLALLVYSFGTFAWEYSQSSYPHLASTFFLLAGYTLLAKALPWHPDDGDAETADGDAEPTAQRRLLWLCFGAGLAAGCAPGMRLDAAFALPALFLPFVLWRPLRWRLAFATAAGLLPGMFFLSLTNLSKFGVFFPFHYGETRRDFFTGNLSWYLPVLAALSAFALWVALLHYLPAKGRRHLLLASGGGLVVLAALFPSHLFPALRQLGEGTWQLLVDLRSRDMAIREPGLSRSPDGALVYIGNVKKALLQSCPYLLVTLLALLDGLRQRRQLPKLAFLCLVPGTFIAFYGYLAWHGSVAVNMRYFNPILPFVALLTACMMRPLVAAISPRLATVAFLAASVALWVIFRFHEFTLLDQELWFLSAPLGIALALLGLDLLRRTRLLPNLGNPLVAYGLLFAIAWSAALTLGRDYPAAARVRGVNLTVGQAFAEHLHDDILVLTDFADFTWHLIDRHDKVRIAGLAEDRADTIALMQHHLDAGRNVYFGGSAYGAKMAFGTGYFQGFEGRMVHTLQMGGLPSVVLLQLRAGAAGNPKGSDS